MSARATIGLLGDVMLGRGVAQRIAADPAARVWSEELVELCRACDALICNLECCVSSGGRRTARIPGKPFFFRAPPAAVDSLTAIGVRAVSLANNHALDYETEALGETLTNLDAAGIAAAGAGHDERAARRGAVIRAGELRVGLLAVTDHPREYAATDRGPGVAWEDLRRGLQGWVTDELARLRTEADLVVAFPHWGPNMTTEPARWQRRRARDLLAAGADIVAGHSAHVFHGVELIDGDPVLYDLGDALDDYAVDPELRNDLGILVRWRRGDDPPLELIPLRLGFCETSVATAGDADWIAARLARACEPLGTTVERAGESSLLVRARETAPGTSRGP